MSLTTPILLALCGLATLPLTAFLLRQACSLWRADLPSYGRAFFSVLFVGTVTYLVLDGGGYLLMRMTAEAGITLAEDYSYRDWLSESAGLKWQATGLVPGTRYLVVLLALCAAGTLQTFTLGGGTTFRISTLIFLTQWAMNAGVFLLFWCLLSLCFAVPQGPDEPSLATSAQVEGKQRLVIRPPAYAGQLPASLAPEPRPGQTEGRQQGSSPQSEEEAREIGKKIDQLTARFEAGDDRAIRGEVEHLRDRVQQLRPGLGGTAPDKATLTAADVRSLKDNLLRIAAFYHEGSVGRKATTSPVSKAEIEELCSRLDRLTAATSAAQDADKGSSHEAASSSAPATQPGEAGPAQGSESPEGSRTDDLPSGEDEAPQADAATEEATGLDSYLDSVRRSSAPVTHRLPPLIQHFLNQGGWWLVIALLAVLSLFWLETFVRRIRTVLTAVRRRQTSRESATTTARIRLADLPPNPNGPRRLTVKGLPVCLRLIVIAPGSSGMGNLTLETAYDVLDGIKHGLGDIAWQDRPRLLRWKSRYSTTGFPRAFHRACSSGAAQDRSPWVLVAGTITVSGQHFFIGLALLADEPNNLNALTVVNEQWLDILGTREHGFSTR